MRSSAIKNERGEEGKLAQACLDEREGEKRKREGPGVRQSVFRTAQRKRESELYVPFIGPESEGEKKSGPNKKKKGRVLIVIVPSRKERRGRRKRSGEAGTLSLEGRRKTRGRAVVPSENALEESRSSITCP